MSVRLIRILKKSSWGNTQNSLRLHRWSFITVFGRCHRVLRSRRSNGLRGRVLFASGYHQHYLGPGRLQRTAKNNNKQTTFAQKRLSAVFFTLSIASDSRCVIPFMLLPFIDNMRSPFRIRPSLSAGLPVNTLYTCVITNRKIILLRFMRIHTWCTVAYPVFFREKGEGVKYFFNIIWKEKLVN